MIESPVILMIDSLGIEYTLKGDNVYVPCPLASRRHGSGEDLQPSFCIQIDQFTFYCHACELRGRGIQSLRKLFKVRGYFFPSSKNFVAQEKPKKIIKPFPRYMSPIYSPRGKPGFDYILSRDPPYSRKDVLKLLHHFHFNYCYDADSDEIESKNDFREYLVLPFECEGVESFTARATGSQLPKHRHQAGSAVGSLLLNYEALVEETTLLVEGPFDLARCWLRGFKNTIGTFGKTISSEQKSLLMKKSPELKNIIIMFDADGLPQAKKLQRELEIFFNVQIAELTGKEQPDSITESRFCKLITQAETRLKRSNV